MPIMNFDPRTEPLQESCSVRRDFSLPEILAVMVIAGILLGIAVGGFRRLAVGSSVDVGTRTVVSQLRLARQLAVVHRKKIALIMPGPNVSIDSKYRFSAMRIAVVTGSGSTYVWKEWLDGTSWVFMPPSASIMEADGDAGIQNADGYSRIPSDDNFTTVNLVPLQQLGGGVADNVRAAVFSSTGKLQGYTNWVTIGEATFTGDWVIRNSANLSTNKSAANQVSIKIDKFTGNTSVKSPSEYE